MISKKIYSADGVVSRYLSDFLIRSDQFTRPYVFIYDPLLPTDGTGDILQNGSTNQADWVWPTNIWKRGSNTAKSADLVTENKWQVVDNSVLFYSPPPSGATVWIEVATTSEEFGDTLTAASVALAEAAATAALSSSTSAATSATAAASSASSASTSDTSASSSATSASTSASSASTSATNAANSATAAASSATSASTSATNAANSASSASTSATNAASSASSASTSATNASSSATAAATSAAEAAASAASIDIDIHTFSNKSWVSYSTGVTRIAGTVYTNTTGGPIMVSIISPLSANVSGTYARLIVGGNEVGMAYGEIFTQYTERTLTAIVPAGATYSFSSVGYGLSEWYELR